MAPHTPVPKPSYNELLRRIKELEDEQRSSMMRQLDEEVRPIPGEDDNDLMMCGAAPVEDQTGEDPHQANQELDNGFDDPNEQPQTQHVVKHQYHSKSAKKQPHQPPEESEDDDHDDDDEQPELDEHADDHQQKQRREKDQQCPAKAATLRSVRHNPKTPYRQQQRQSHTPSTRKPTTQRHLPPSSNPLLRAIAL
ncbi:hypothetical protein KEM55_003648 [Ascosphaera atra]|nr:hypothetical protein KEM55_003648 [Ascosphaera atra]